MEEKEQVIEVEYDKDLVEEYKNNYIMEEDGIGDIDSEPYGVQTTFNESTFEEMNEDGEVILEEVIEDDKNE